MADARGHAQRGARLGVVVQAGELGHLSTAVVVPTSRSRPQGSLRPEIAVLEQPTTALVDQVRAVDVQRLVEHVGQVSPGEMRAIDDALELLLGLR